MATDPTSVDPTPLAAASRRGNPARARLVERARRGAFVVLVGVSTLAVVSSLAVALWVGTAAASGDLTTSGLVFRLIAGFGLVMAALVGVARLVAGRSTGLMEALFQQEDTLIRSVAHEVRRPLSHALVALDEGLEGVNRPDDAMAEAANRVEDSNELIGDLMETAEVMTGAAPLAAELVDLDEAATEAATTSTTAGCSVKLDLEPVTVTGSSRLLRRAVSNLVRNACRHGYGDQAGVVGVRVDATGVTVTDDGPGVDPDRLRGLHFDSGITTDNQERGLGLNICGWVAEMHGGSLDLANRPEGGFEARLALPTTPAGHDRDSGGIGAAAPS